MSEFINQLNVIQLIINLRKFNIFRLMIDLNELIKRCLIKK